MIRSLLQWWDRRVRHARSCIRCGCTERWSCRGGCWWADPFHCSNCVSSTKRRRLWAVE